MFFGMFGSIFLLAQFFQTVQGYSPLGSGPADPAVDARADVRRAGGRDPSDRNVPKKILGTGFTLQAVALGWIAFVSTPTTPYSELIAPFIIAGVGMALFFAPMANVVLSAVGRKEEGQASGANNAIRELGGVFGVAVLASVFARYGGYETGQTFVNGMTPALWIGAIVVAFGAVAAFAIPAVQRRGASAARPRPSSACSPTPPEVRSWEPAGAGAPPRLRLPLTSRGRSRSFAPHARPPRCCP